MCIRIIGIAESLEFNPSEPLENQIAGAQEIVVNYDPYDLKISSFVGQMELMVKNGISCTANIRVNPNNHLEGLKLERCLERIKRKLDVNEIAKNLVICHAETDSKLCELSEMCMEKFNE